MSAGEKTRLLLLLCAAALVLLAPPAGPAPRAAAQNVVPQEFDDNGVDDGEAEEGDDESSMFSPGLDTSVDVERMLTIARNQAAAGDYSDAGQTLADLLASRPRTVSPMADGLYLPLWRVAIEEIAAWPVEGVQAYQSLIAREARDAHAAALQTADLRDLEAVAQQYFLSKVGASAAIILGDRLREAGRPALALYYYVLVLERHPGGEIPRRDVELRAALAAREAGMPDRYEALAARLEGVTLRSDPGAREVKAAEWLAAQPPQECGPADAAGGFGNLSDAAPVAPATVTWDVPLAKPPDRRNMWQPAFSGAGTPPVYPTLAGHIVYAANLYSVWAIDARDGSTLWRFDTRGADETGLPPTSYLQARQPLVHDGVVYVPLEVPPDNQAQAAVQMLLVGSSFKTDLHALDAASGEPLWHWSPRSDRLQLAALSVDGQPVTDGRLVLVSLLSQNNFFGEVHVAALDRRDGQLVWAQPLVAYQTSFAATTGYGYFSRDVAGMSLAARGGLLLSSGVGVTTAQSALSGSILWSRVKTDMRCPPTPTRRGIVRPAQQPAETDAITLARQPRVLAERGLVVAGFTLSPTLTAYDWLDGRIVWQQDAEGARQPVAIAGDHVVAWGRTVMDFDLRTGRKRRQAAEWPERIVGEPIVAGDKVLAPTAEGIVTMDLASGRIEATSVLPSDVAGGNLALGPFGLLIVSESAAVCMHDWETAREMFLAQAAADPADAGPLITLGAAALRLAKTEPGLGYLDEAMTRNPSDEDRARIYHLYEDFYRVAILQSGDEVVMRLLDRLRESATSGSDLARQAFLRAEYVSQRDPRAALAAIQEILDDPASRHVRISGPAGPGVSGILAEEAIERLVRKHGRGVYAPWERAADVSRRKARAAGDYPALLETAQRYPNSAACREALDDALALLLERQEIDEADRLLARLVNLTPEGGRETAYRSLLVDTSARLGHHGYARLLAGALAGTASRETAVRQADGSVADVGQVLDRAAQLPDESSRRPAGSSQGLAEPPYSLAWTLTTPKEYGSMQAVGELTRTTADDLDQATDPLLYFFNNNHVVGVDRLSGNTVWDHTMETDQQNRFARCFLGRTGLYVAGSGYVARLDQATGHMLWRIRLEPERPRRLFAPRESVTGALCYGDTGWKVGSGQVPSRFEELGDKFLVSTSYSLHLIDPRDGYTLQTVGYPHGVYYGGFIRYGPTAMGIPLRPQHMFSRALFYDLATGDLDSEIELGQQVVPSPTSPHGSRWWPLFAQGSQQVVIVDLEHRRAGPMIQIEDQNPRYWTRQALADGKRLYIISAGSELHAVDPDERKTLWTYQPADTRVTAMSAVGEDRLLAISNVGIAMLRASDGTPVWEQTLANGQSSNVVVRSVRGKHILAMVNQRTERQYVSYHVLMDAESGRVLFTFRRPDEPTIELMHIDAAGVVVRTGRSESPQYWVSDPVGEWDGREEEAPDAEPGDVDSPDSD